MLNFDNKTLYCFIYQGGSYDWTNYEMCFATNFDEAIKILELPIKEESQWEGDLNCFSIKWGMDWGISYYEYKHQN